MNTKENINGRSNTFYLKLLWLAPLAITAVLSAQPARSTNQLVQTQPDALKVGVDLFYSYSPESELERGGRIGDVSVGRYDLRLNASKRLTEDTNLLLGLAQKYTELDLAGSVPLPEKLNAVELSVGAQRKLDDWFGPAWRGTVMLQTEFSSDSSGLSDAEAIFGGAVTVGYQQSPTLLWTFGILARSEGNLSVLPVIGGRWEFAPRWALSIGVPSTGVIYTHSERLSILAGLTFFDGLYRVSNSQTPGLNDTWLEHEEFRVGIRATYRFHPRFEFTVGGGAVLGREFDYYDRDYSIDGKNAGYLTLGVSARF